MKQRDDEAAISAGAQRIWPALDKASPAEKREILIRMMLEDPQGLVKLSPGSASPGRGAHLESVDCRGLDLTGADLCRAVLRKADLTSVGLDKANLSHADLAGASLRGATLRSADLRSAMLEDAAMEGVNLRFADLRGALLENANLTQADMWGADLEDAVLAGANLTAVFLNEANLRHADFSGSSLNDARLDAACLEGATLRGADLTGTRMEGANLRGAILAEANLQGVNLLHCDLTHISVAGAWLDKTRLSQEQLGGETGEERAGCYEEAARAYLALERNFAGLGDKEAASWAYRKRRRMEKRFAFGESSSKLRQREWRRACRWQARAVSDQLVEWMCDYGESVPRVLATLLVIYLFFTALYAVTGSVVHVPSPPGSGHSVRASLSEVAIFSLLAMSTSGTPAVGLQPGSVFVHLFTGAQALLGIALTGLLGFVLGNRIRR